MSLTAGRNFDLALTGALTAANLPINVMGVIGRVYRFDCEHGSHHHILVGTILAIEVSDEGGLELHVSSPKLWGQKIKCITHTSKGWAVVRHINQEVIPYDQAVFLGEFKLL